MSAIRRVMTVVLCSLLLLGCQENGFGVSESETDIPDLFASEKLACERKGGNWALTPGRVAFTCYEQTRDANKFCATQRDCEGLCLARSRTCSPVKPMFGCHEILNADGVRQTLCVE